MLLDKDAFSSGQILSKLWLAEELERVVYSREIVNPLSILALGGWYGIHHLILKIRSNIEIKQYRNLDIDAMACEQADLLNEAWVWQNWQFKSICADANNYDYSCDNYDLIINTSVEHIESKRWFEKIPNNTLIVLQSNNMSHDDHCHNHHSLNDFVNDFPLTFYYFKGEKLFEYPEWCFKRFMIIGRK